MSISSILSSLTGTTAHGAFSTQSATSTASEELQKLFSKLHMDAIASATTDSSSATSTAATSTSTSTTSSTSASGGALTDIASGLRHILDGGITAIKDARSAAKAVSGYTHGAGLGHLAAQALDKVA
ncbi:hypothetical protein [Sphingomonas abietis]|uniref:Uncharacterized protein n=1 Tax=Sphingomonas abietis TaxID=3012344 RepID=A0ABY7NLF4_9SPHN|nr:hypothetical protein [Sphingomonas abietis]WBO22067.1 hypothetical protein PBT88_18210 [Sphingomonas abietis]